MPSRKRRDEKPPAALFIPPTGNDDDSPPEPPEPKPTRKRPSAAPFAAPPAAPSPESRNPQPPNPQPRNPATPNPQPPNPESPSTPTPRARPIPRQFTFTDADTPPATPPAKRPTKRSPAPRDEQPLPPTVMPDTSKSASTRDIPAPSRPAETIGTGVDKAPKSTSPRNTARSKAGDDTTPIKKAAARKPKPAIEPATPPSPRPRKRVAKGTDPAEPLADMVAAAGLPSSVEPAASVEAAIPTTVEEQPDESGTTPVKPAPRKRITKRTTAEAPTTDEAAATEPAPIETTTGTEPDAAEVELITTDTAAPPPAEQMVRPPADRTRADLPSDADLIRVIRARPQLTSAVLAVAAVARFGESARDHADWLRRTYPAVGPERLANDAVRVANRRTRYAVGTTLVGGQLGIAAGVSTLTWAHARLVIDVAAVFGHDPLHPSRAADVLVLLGAYPDRLSAAKAVSEVAGDLPDADLTEPTSREPMIVAAATQSLTRAASRLLPGAAVLVSAIRTSTATERLAGRAIRYFRKRAEA